MASSYDSSPYELGELAPSPDRRHVQVYSAEERDELSLSPHGVDTFDDTEDITDDDKKLDDDGDGSESLDIKPPQMQAGRREKTHKHRHKEERRRDKRHRDYDDKERFGHHRGSVRDKHAPKDAREHIQEKRREKERKRKEEEDREARKREESIRERERLERLERERQRERRLRDTREPKSAEKKRWEDERRLGSGKGDERHRHRRREEDRFRSRSRDDHVRQAGQSSGERSFDQDQRKVEERGHMRGPHTPEEVYVEDEGEQEEDEQKQEEEEGEHSERELNESPGQQEDEANRDFSPHYRSHSGSSGDHRHSDSPSLSPSHRSAEDVNSQHSSDEETNHITNKLRSKFDDQSGSEEEGMQNLTHEERIVEEDEDGKEIYALDDGSTSPDQDPENLPVYYPAFMGCRSVEEFHCLNRIEEGTYGVVYRARCKKTAQIVALKRLKMEKEKEGFPITSLREINTLLKAQHPNIVTVREIVVGSNMDKIYIVMDYVAHDLKSLMESMKQPFSIGETKTLMIQLLRAVNHMHDNWILHRDLKTSNLLLSHNGILKVGDFGLAREYGSPLKSYTQVVVTLWYRAPELLLLCKKYSTHIDMWSVGCIFAELLTLKPLWPGKSEVDQINRIFKDLGTPNETIWPGVSELPGYKKITFTQYTYNQIRKRFGSYLSDLGFELLNKFLTYDPVKRGTAEECLEDEYFKEAPLPTDPSMFPTWPAKSEQTRKHTSSPKPPSGGKAYASLMGDDDDTFYGFHMAGAMKGASAQGPGFQLKF